MAGSRDCSKITPKSVKQESANITVWKVRREGHIYVEIRQDRGRLVFFCVLCLAPCYGETPLLEHLSGRAHREKYAYAEVTLLAPNPWPFNDGVFFFNNPSEQDLASLNNNKGRLLITDGSNDDVNVDQMLNGNGDLVIPGVNNELVIPGVLRGDELSSLEVKLIGFGKIGARTYENVQGRQEINRIWCAWLGKKSSEEEDMDMLLPQHDFGVITFSYNYNLGRIPVWRDFDQIVASDTCLEIENGHGKSKRIKLMSGHEDKSQALSEQCNSSVEDNQISGSDDLEVVSADKLQNSKSRKKRYRRQMRQEQCLASERVCDLCNIRLLPGKDVACLINMKTGRLACSSRNTTGAFHLFHTSCLLHWILLCEVEIRTNRIANEAVPHKPTRKTRGGKRNTKQADANNKATPKKISSVFCPECQGTGIIVEDQLEKPSFLLPEMFTYKMKSKHGQSEWIKSPEILQNCCSVGFHFPLKTEGLDKEQVENLKSQEQVVDLKLLHFFRADV
ncbi:hypothetical protein ACHQM5_003128 [Ranunculus cassubicifolius]